MAYLIGGDYKPKTQILRQLENDLFLTYFPFIYCESDQTAFVPEPGTLYTQRPFAGETS